MSRQDEPEFDMKRMSAIIDAAMRFKAAMIERGKTAATGKCPFCESGRWSGQLAGRKNHLHVACDGCDVAMME